MAERIVQVPDMVTVGELAATLDIPVTKLIGELFKNGIAATINQRIDVETAQIIVDELGLDIALEKQEAASRVKESNHKLSEHAASRPPIVAVMGHVDHGKTTLLDAVLDMKVVEGEAGGITQHISAYQTIRNNRSITLLDTPGHEAFSALRQHGATLTDVVVIVVAADDGVKPQTVEAIKFAESANAKIVVAITKCDKETANVERVKAQLASEYNMNPEEWGGDTIMVPISAKTGQGIDKLLDMVLLVADMEELKADVDVPAEGLIIESHLETGKGPVVSMLIEHGQLKPSQFIVSGTTYAKVRTLSDYAGRPIKMAGPATPATITGYKEVPSFGDRFIVVKNEKVARSLAEKNRLNEQHEVVHAHVTGNDLLRMMNRQTETQDINVVVRADVQGSLTSVADSLKLLQNDELIMRILSSGVGNITENDIRLAASADAIVYGFNVQLPPTVKRLAARDKVSVRIFKVIYELLDDVRGVMEGMLAPEVVETEIGKLKVLGIFRTTRDGVICGGEVLSGKIAAGLLVRVVRDKETLAEVEVHSVKRQQAEAKEVFEGEQCGLELKTKGKLTLLEGDRLEFFTRELKKRTL